MEIDPKKLMKLLTPLATLTGAVKSAENLTPSGSLDRWTESLLRHGKEAEGALDQLMGVFLRMMEAPQADEVPGQNGPKLSTHPASISKAAWRIADLDNTVFRNTKENCMTLAQYAFEGAGVPYVD